MRPFSLRRFVLVFCETGLILSGVALAAVMRLGVADAWDLVLNQFGAWKAALFTGVIQFCFYYTDLYDLRRIADRRELIVRTVQGLGTASLALAVIYYCFPDSMVGRGVFVLAIGFALVMVPAWRLTFEWFGQRLVPRERLLLVGTNDAAVTLARELHERRHELGVKIVGFVDPDPARVGQPVLNPGVIGTIEDIPSIVKSTGADRVVVSLADARGKLPMDQLLQMRLERGVTFDHLASVYEEYTGKIAIANLRPSWLIFSEGFRHTPALLRMKRAIDIVLSAVALTVLAPTMLVVAALVKLTSPGPAFYHQERVGTNGKVFTVHKLRTMRVNAEAATGAVWASARDARVTPIGSLLRRLRFDETPQLWNVLTGEMSLVGPRPERPEFVSQLTEKIPYYGLRHAVRPGLTGWAQVRYAYGASVEDALEKLQYDLYYVKHMATGFDLMILFETIKTVILQRGAQ